MDFAKAYDSIDRGSPYTILKNFNIPTKLIHIIQAASAQAHESRAVVSVGPELIDDFAVITGLKQGHALSPTLFNVALEFVVRTDFFTVLTVSFNLLNNHNDLFNFFI